MLLQYLTTQHFPTHFFTGGYAKHKKELLRICHAKTDFFFQITLFFLDGNPKLFNTMTITNVGIEDGSQYGNFESYECHAFAKNESTPKRHGFSISVITSKLLHL